jgi:hypothetical protein
MMGNSPTKQGLKVLLGANGAALWQLLRFGGQAFGRAAQRAFFAAYRAPSAGLAAIPEVDLEILLGERKPRISLAVMRYEEGMLSSAEAMPLLALLVAEQPAEVLEIGTYMGHTTALMARNLASALIHTVDLPEDFPIPGAAEGRSPKDDLHLIARREVGREFRSGPDGKRIVQHFHDTADWDFSGAGRPTFVFIDGAHTYAYCKNDSEKCLAISGERAVFLWHDCDDAHPGVVQFLGEWRKAGRDIRRITGTALAYWKKP